MHVDSNQFSGHLTSRFRQLATRRLERALKNAVEILYTARLDAEERPCGSYQSRESPCMPFPIPFVNVPVLFELRPLSGEILQRAYCAYCE